MILFCDKSSSSFNVVEPATSKAPFTVRSSATYALAFMVVLPETAKLPKLTTSPLTSNFPATDVLPVAEATVNLFAFTAKSPSTSKDE